MNDPTRRPPRPDPWPDRRHHLIAALCHELPSCGRHAATSMPTGGCADPGRVR